MDVDRYLKSVQDRVVYGVKTAIVNAGYRTEEFAQKVVYISNGGHQHRLRGGQHVRSR
ncbi:hypothetical protein [Streptomyces sp. NPDC048565]|uniref:hypothetical protein n=1 Tax=Streptomyces sp. NPDC048565 TaxID=3155266 RepID=UPI00343EED1A